MVASEVDLGDHGQRENHHQQGRLGEETDQHFTAAAKGAERGADVHAGQRNENARQAKDADQRQGVGRRREGQVGG
jgi:hypothetical protein